MHVSSMPYPWVILILSQAESFCFQSVGLRRAIFPFPRLRINSCVNLAQVPFDTFTNESRRGEKLKHRAVDYEQDWGIEKDLGVAPRFPARPMDLIDDAWEAVVATMHGEEKLDPNVLANARSSSILKYRPVRRDHDRGRIGIEIDGAQNLFSHSNPRHRQSALRLVSLLLAAKLSEGPWEGFEEKQKEFTRPVAIYFNTIKQSLVASQDLANLRQLYDFNFDNIVVGCLGQDEIPEHMQNAAGKRVKRLAKGMVDPRQGVIIVVQPTDFNDEFRPPGPSIGTLGDLQQLSTRAQIHALPVVVVSPRFLSHKHHEYPCWDQSGYQASEVYGGVEPPRGPTPWVMRDFSPPVFVWISASSHPPRQESLLDMSPDPAKVSLLYSVMHERHKWHLFSVEKGRNGFDQIPDYKYLASTRKASGRPPMAVLRYVMNQHFP
mmetsp:Transcript_6084/g.10612  ORF Transcript_6084/g.10612 Transcript_6084/m.10612 type:complete len:435 (+) Transcript_6084:837-2141(+)